MHRPIAKAKIPQPSMDRLIRLRGPRHEWAFEASVQSLEVDK